MSLKFKYGDMFDEPKGYIMHGCNAQGVMGSGVANIIRQRYHEAYKVYALQFPNYIMGEVIPVRVADDLVIINAITQDDYGTHKIQADYDAIRQAMRGAVHVVSSGWDGVPQELHMPFIGAGLAGGDPDTIVAIMQEELADASVDATLWLYDIEHLYLFKDEPDDVLWIRSPASE